MSAVALFRSMQSANRNCRAPANASPKHTDALRQCRGAPINELDQDGLSQRSLRAALCERPLQAGLRYSSFPGPGCRGFPGRFEFAQRVRRQTVFAFYGLVVGKVAKQLVQATGSEFRKTSTFGK